MTKTIRISSEIERYLEKYGKFGESHDDVLKRNLKNFGEFMNDKKRVLMQTIPVISEIGIKIQEWVYFIDVTCLSSSSKEWMTGITEFTLENGEPVSWKGGNIFLRCNGQELESSNYIPYTPNNEK